MPQLPVILTAFANSYDTTYLGQLGQEHDSLQKTLAPLSYLRHVPLSGATTRHLVDTLNQYKQELLIFHFGGHADGAELMFEDKAGKVSGLADLLSLHPHLKLVLLNGCNTQAQVIQYLDAGIPAVIATTFSIKDGTARLFAEVFYEALVYGHTLQEAFIRAKGAVKLEISGVLTDEVITVRGVRLRKEVITEAPWRLYARDNVLNFRLTDLQNLPKTKHAKKGVVLYQIPKTMQLQHETKCIIRIAMDEEIIVEGILLDEDTVIKDRIGISDQMEAKLIDPARTPAFSIRSTSEPMQLIDEDIVTEWKFYVTPIIVGQHELELKIIIIKKIGGDDVRHETTFEEKILIETEAVEDAEIGFAETDIKVEVTSTKPLYNQIVIGDHNFIMQEKGGSYITINSGNPKSIANSPKHSLPSTNYPDSHISSPEHIFYNISITEEHKPMYELKLLNTVQTINKCTPIDKLGNDLFDLSRLAPRISILQLNSEQGELSISNEGIFSDALANLKYKLNKLKLVILSCCTPDLVLKLLQIDIPAVLILEQRINDPKSRLFLDIFYEKLISEDSLLNVYQYACLRVEEQPMIHFLSDRMDLIPQNSHPYNLYISNETTLGWKFKIDRSFDPKNPLG